MPMWQTNMRITAARLNALQPTVVRKLVDESRASTTTLTADSALLLPNLVANAVYQVELVALLKSTTSGTTPGAKVDFTIPSGATMVNPTFLYSLPSTNFNFAQTNGSVITISLATTATPFRIAALLVMGASTGTLTWRWAQNTSNAANTTVAAGSFLRAERID